MTKEKKITFAQMCDPAFRRTEQFKIKSEAVWASFIELNGLLNLSKFAKQFFGKSQSWFAQKLYGLTVCNKQREFTAEEYHRISESFREIAKRLEMYADAIDSADDK